MNLGEKMKVNLAVLKRHDSSIVSILDSSSHTVLYLFKENQWKKCSVEGTLFVFHRTKYPKYGFTVINRLGIDNLTVYLTPDINVNRIGDYVIYKDTRDQSIHGLWMYEEDDRERLGNVLSRYCQTRDDYDDDEEEHVQQPKKRGNSLEPKVDIIQMLQKAASRASASLPNDDHQQHYQPMIHRHSPVMHSDSPNHHNQFHQPQQNPIHHSQPHYAQHNPNQLHPPHFQHGMHNGSIPQNIMPPQFMNYPSHHQTPPPAPFFANKTIHQLADVWDIVDGGDHPRSLVVDEFRRRFDVLIKDPNFIQKIYHSYKTQ